MDSEISKNPAYEGEDGEAGDIADCNLQDMPAIFRLSKNKTNGQPGKKEKIGHRRVTEEGTVTYKKKTTSDIQRAIQLGIQHSIGVTHQRPKLDVLLRDFTEVVSDRFPSQGSKTTPAHSLSDFTFKTYAPVAFRAFRDNFELDMRDFLNSLCIRELRELSNPGASGSIFYISEDDEFIIKTVQHREADFLQRLLQEYYINLVQNPRTLLPKFYGLYSYRSGGKNIRFVVMNNILPSCVKIHEKYDLKGSSYKRQASDKEKAKASPTLKDLDFRELHPNGIWLEEETYNALMNRISRDVRVLESFNIMDYSLLLGIHNLDKAKRDRQKRREEMAPPGNNNYNRSPPDRPSPDYKENEIIAAANPSGEEEKSKMQRGKSTKRVAAYSTALETIFTRSPEPLDLEDEEQNVRHLGGIPARNSNGDRLLLYLGIIDILQSYRIVKKLEHQFKAVAIDAKSVSVTHPKFYAQRFEENLRTRVFRHKSSLDDDFFGPHRARFRNLVHMAMKQQANPKRKSTLGNRPSTFSRTIDEEDTAIESSRGNGQAGGSGVDNAETSEPQKSRVYWDHAKPFPADGAATAAAMMRIRNLSPGCKGRDSMNRVWSAHSLQREGSESSNEHQRLANQGYHMNTIGPSSNLAKQLHYSMIQERHPQHHSHLINPYSLSSGESTSGYGSRLPDTHSVPMSSSNSPFPGSSSKEKLYPGSFPSPWFVQSYSDSVLTEEMTSSSDSAATASLNSQLNNKICPKYKAPLFTPAQPRPSQAERKESSSSSISDMDVTTIQVNDHLLASSPLVKSPPPPPHASTGDKCCGTKAKLVIL